MNKKIVKIPNVTEEVRIGYSFNYMIKVIAETEAAECAMGLCGCLVPTSLLSGTAGYL